MKLIELFTSDDGTLGESIDRHYLAVDAETLDDIEALVAAAKIAGDIPFPSWRGLAYQTYQHSPKGGNVWEVIVRYGKLEQVASGSYEWQLTTGGENIKRTQSLATIAKYPTLATGNTSGVSTANPIVVTTAAAHGLVTGDTVTIADVEGVLAANGQWVVTVLSSTTFSIPTDGTGPSLTINGTWTRAAAPDFKGLIGVNGGRVEGVEVPGPGVSWTETFVIPKGTITAAYIAGVANMNGMVNNATFRGFAAGEVMFLFMTGGKRSREDLSLTYHFRRERNATNIPVGHLTIAAKEGQQYVWSLFEDVKQDSGQKFVAPKLKGVYVEKVAEYWDFSALGIGTSSIWELP